jgi:acid phosphatase (class A)
MKVRSSFGWGVLWFVVLLAGPAFAADVMEGAFMTGGVKVYIDPAKFDSTRYMAPPPVGMDAQEDMRAVERWQELRTKAMEARSLADSEQSVFIFADVLGDRFVADNFPMIKTFFHSIYRTESNLNKQGKDRWARQRPPASNANLKPVGKFANEGAYPSGHAAFGWLAGIVLADMVPENRDLIMARAREMSFNRVVGGVHFPSDVEAGRILAVACAVEIRNNPAYLADFEEARLELRKGLGLSLRP